MSTIYLDNNATTRPADEVAEAVDRANRELWANPSSVHRPGQRVRQQLELARASVAELIGARPRELVFTSGGTESNTLAIAGTLGAMSPGAMQSGKVHPGAAHPGESGEPRAALLTTAIEHSAVREPAEALREAGASVEMLTGDEAGGLSPSPVTDAAERLASDLADGGTLLVSIQWANNETGVIQPIAEIAAALDALRQRLRESSDDKRVKVLLHVDATQAVGKLPVDVKHAGVDLLTLAGHKLHGPKATGALYIRTGVRLRPVQRGGPQERERRGGTENVPGIFGLGVAARLARDFLADADRIDALRALRDGFERRILERIEDAAINAGGPDVPRLWNTSNLAFPGLEAEAILVGLSEKGVCASAGAACSSGSLEPSPVLLAMGYDEPRAHGSVRFSLSRETTRDELDRAAAITEEVVSKLRKTMPVG